SSVATEGSAIATGSRGGTVLRSRTRCAHATIIPASNAENSANETNALADTLYIQAPPSIKFRRHNVSRKPHESSSNWFRVSGSASMFGCENRSWLDLGARLTLLRSQRAGDDTPTIM